MFLFLMFSAPLAYATYLSPHFEASQFGWSNWWKSLINNAAFAPLMMMFLSISILIMQSASLSIPAGSSITDFLNDPSKQVLANGWRVLFVYLLGTALLFISFRLSSSLAGSISGIKMGQMAAGIPLAFGARGAAFFGQRSIGWAANKSAASKGAQASTARMNMLKADSKEEKEFFRKQAEKFERQKGRRETVAGSSFNLMNTAAGKSMAGSAGLKGVFAGEKKGSFKDDVDAKSKAALERAAKTNLTDDDKAKVRAEAEKEADAKAAPQRDAATAKVAAAEEKLAEAKKERAAISDAVVTAAKTAVEGNRSARGDDIKAAAKELADAESSHTSKIASNDKEIANLAAQERATAGTAKEKITQQLITRRAEHASELGKQKERIEAAHSRIVDLNEEIEAPLKAIKMADGKIAHRQSEVASTVGDLKKVDDAVKFQKTSPKGSVATAVREIEKREAEYKPERFRQVAKKEGRFMGGAVQHKLEHDLAHKFKTQSTRDKFLAALKNVGKADDKKADDGADTVH